MENDDILDPVLERRQILRTAGLGLFGLGLTRIAGATTLPRILGQTEDSEGDIDVSDLVGDPAFADMCVLTPSETAGPYYLNLNLVRTDITEGQPGLKSRILIRVVRASDCSPVPNATLDVWHASAPGKYSGFANQGTLGQTWLRGVQFTDANGLGYFDTIFPGWYPGRTTHIHLKVRPTPQTELTTQLYFQQSLINRINKRQPYASHGDNPTTNATDGLFLDETVMSVLGVMSGRLHLELVIGLA